MRALKILVVGTAAFGVALASYGCSGGGNDNPDGGGGSDAGKDSKPDVVKVPDSGTDTSNDTCPTPQDVSGFAPSDAKGAKAPQDVCSSTQIDDFYTNCLDTAATTTTCNNWLKTAANQTCSNCLNSKQTDATWSALVSKTGLVSVNIEGCIALVTGGNPPTTGDCAYKYQAASDCEGAACDAVCPVTDQPSFQLYEQCAQAAAAGGCKTYEDAVCDPEGQTWANCLDDQGLGFEGLFKSVAPLFCSSGG